MKRTAWRGETRWSADQPWTVATAHYTTRNLAAEALERSQRRTKWPESRVRQVSCPEDFDPGIDVYSMSL